MLISHIDDGSVKLAISGDLQHIASECVLMIHEIYKQINGKDHDASEQFKRYLRITALNRVMFDRDAEESMNEDEIDYIKSILDLADMWIDKEPEVQRVNPLEGATER